MRECGLTEFFSPDTRIGKSTKPVSEQVESTLPPGGYFIPETIYAAVKKLTDHIDHSEREDVERAMVAAKSGDAGHWPTVAAVLRDEVLRLRAMLS
jgi:hypothetical protein